MPGDQPEEVVPVPLEAPGQSPGPPQSPAPLHSRHQVDRGTARTHPRVSDKATRGHSSIHAFRASLPSSGVSPGVSDEARLTKDCICCSSPCLLPGQIVYHECPLPVMHLARSPKYHPFWGCKKACHEDN